MFPVTCDNASKIIVNATPNGRLDGALRIRVDSGDGTFEQDPATPNSFKAVSGAAVFDPNDPASTVGITVYKVSGDVRAGADESLIEEDVVLTVTAVPEPEATNLGFSVGAVEPK
jgi:hypothetical protein